MEENKELETTTEEQASVTPAANDGEKKGLFLSGLIVGFAATLLIVGGIFIAFQIHNIMTMKDDVAAQVSYGEDSAVNAQTIKKLQLLEDTVKENFYLSEVTNEQLEDGMFRGLMDSLDDPYSEYYTAEELNELTEQTQGIYFGIGAYVSMDSETNLPKISGVIEGAPAADVDLRANDIIYEVDGVSTAGKTLTEAVNMIRGEAGTTVDLTIVRQGAGDYLHVTVERAKVESEMIPFSSLESFTRESIRNRSFSDCLYSASTFAFADAGRVSSIKSSLYNSRFAIGVFVWWEMSAIKVLILSFSCAMF